MLVLRCTRKLLRRLRETPVDIAPRSTTTLGDWYANVLFVHRQPIILAVSARTLLPVLVPARDSPSLGPRFAAALAEILVALGVPAHQIREEQRQMAPVVFAATSSRQILGTMNDFDRMLDPCSRIHRRRRIERKVRQRLGRASIPSRLPREWRYRPDIDRTDDILDPDSPIPRWHGSPRRERGHGTGA